MPTIVFSSRTTEPTIPNSALKQDVASFVDRYFGAVDEPAAQRRQSSSPSRSCSGACLGRSASCWPERNSRCRATCSGSRLHTHLAGSILTYVIGKPLVPANFDLQRFNADFRFRMIRIRENAESIALYAGERRERDGLERQLSATSGTTTWRIMILTKRLNWFGSFYDQLRDRVPISRRGATIFCRRDRVRDHLPGLRMRLAGFRTRYPGSSACSRIWRPGKRPPTVLSPLSDALEQRRKPTRATDPCRRAAGCARGRLVRFGYRHPDRSHPDARRADRNPPRRQGADLRPLGQRQDHALPRARRPVAVREGQATHSEGCARAVPVAEALSAARHAARGGRVPERARHLHRRSDQGGAGRRAPAASGEPSGRGRELVDDPVRRRAAAHRHRPCPAQQAGLAVHGRGNLRPRRGERAARLRSW